MGYIGEHRLPGQFGHFFIVLSLVASLVAAFSYFKSAQSPFEENEQYWKRLGRIAFMTEVISVFAVATVGGIAAVLQFAVFRPLGVAGDLCAAAARERAIAAALE